MKRIRIAAAVLAAAGFLPAAAASASGTNPDTTIAVAAATPTAALAAYPAPSGTWPTDWPAIADYTQTITIAVPPTWGQMEIMPITNDDGSPRPWLAATPDMNAFLPADGSADTFSVPGVVMMAYPGTLDTLGTLQASEYHAVCTPAAPATLTRGLLSGHIQEFTGCGGTSTRLVQFAGTISGAPHTYLLLVQLTGGETDASVLDGILSSFSPLSAPAG